MGRKLSEKEVADRTGMSVHWYRRKRLLGTGGPSFYKIGGSVKYDEDELEAWLRSLKRFSTTQDRAPEPALIKKRPITGK